MIHHQQREETCCQISRECVAAETETGLGQTNENVILVSKYVARAHVHVPFGVNSFRTCC